MHRNFAIYLTLLSICLLAGVTTLLIGPSLHWVKAADTLHFKLAIMNAPEKAEGEVTSPAPYDGYDRVRFSHKLNKKKNSPPPADIVNFDLNDTSLYSSIPPLSSDLAIVMDELRNKGVTNIHYYISFHNENDEPAKGLIKGVLAANKEPAIENFLIPLQLTRSTHNHKPPRFLEPSTIALKDLDGDYRKIPKVDKIIFSPIDKINFSNGDEIIEFPNITFGFTSIETEQQDGNKIPLIAIWDNRVIFHQLLLSTLILHDLDISDISIEIGKQISFGKGKPIIPIDAFGYASIQENTQQITPEVFAASDILDEEVAQLTGEDSAISQKKFQEHVLITSTPSPDYNMSLVEQPYTTLNQFYQVKVYDKLHQFFRLPLWLEAIILVELTLVCAFLYRCKQFDRHLIYALIMALLFPLTMLLSSSTGYWLPITPLLATLFSGWLISTLISNRWQLRRTNDSADKELKKELQRFE